MSTRATQVGLLQHGTVDAGDVFCGDLETPLSSQGWKYLKQKYGRSNRQWDVVVTSPKSQCLTFAQWFAQKHDVPLVEDERLREIHFGEWEGCSPQQVLNAYPEELAQWWASPLQVTPPQGEPFLDFQERVLAAWSEIPSNWRGERVLVVTHVHVIRVILGEVLRVPPEKLCAINVEYGALSQLRVLRDRDGEWASLLTHGC